MMNDFIHSRLTEINKLQESIKLNKLEYKAKIEKCYSFYK